MKFIKESTIETTPERLFAFHESPDALELLIPPWEKARIIQAAQISKVGSRAVIETRLLWFLKVRWVALHTAYDPPRMFEDVQVKGPFRIWRHRHIVIPSVKSAILRDEIDYQLPLGFFGILGARLLVEPRLKRLFNYRHKVTEQWCRSPDSHRIPEPPVAVS